MTWDITTQSQTCEFVAAVFGLQFQFSPDTFFWLADNDSKQDCIKTHCASFCARFGDWLCLRNVIITWRYSPSWALASCAIRLHCSLSWAFLLHPTIPISCRSSWTSSGRLTLGSIPFSRGVNFLSHHCLRHSTVLHSFYVTDPTYPSCLHKPNYIFFPYYIIYFLIIIILHSLPVCPRNFIVIYACSVLQACLQRLSLESSYQRMQHISLNQACRTCGPRATDRTWNRQRPIKAALVEADRLFRRSTSLLLLWKPWICSRICESRSETWFHGM